MTEIELSALVRQCLNRYIPDQDILDAESQAWTKERNEKVVKVDWRFTTADARIKLKHLYPKIQVWQQATSIAFKLRHFFYPWPNVTCPTRNRFILPLKSQTLYSLATPAHAIH
jgi:hypothetical protein